VYLDSNGDGSYQAGEPGLEGITVTLTTSDGVVFTTYTNENGHYTFGNLDADTYTVTVALPAGYAYSDDPDVTVDGESSVVLGAGAINLDQDFGLEASTPLAISGTLWDDADADGVLEGTESSRFEGVTVVLYDDNGNIVATTTTDASGDYSFTGLPDGATYTVDVTDDANVLNGYWHSEGDQSQGVDNNSKADPYTVTLSGTNVDTVDFGYYKDPASLGNLVWLDRDGDGIQEPSTNNEPGIEGITVTLTITYPTTGGDTVITLVTVTGDGGYYSFDNLLLDEDFDGAGGSEPQYTISISPIPGLTSVTAGLGDGKNDSDDQNGAVAQPIQGVTDITAQPSPSAESDAASYDFGFIGAVDLGDLPDEIGGSPDYPTLFGFGPAHIIFPSVGNVPQTTNGTPAVWLGTIVDVEGDGQPGASATGDDDNTDDEDGFFFAATGWITNTNSTVDVVLNASESGTTVYYGIWIDWDQNGEFEAFYSGSGITSSPVTETVTIAVPATYVPNSDVFFRVRVSDRALVSSDYDGSIVNGEVEDYRRSFSPTAVSLSSFTNQTQGMVENLFLATGFIVLFIIGGMVFVFKRRKVVISDMKNN